MVSMTSVCVNTAVSMFGATALTSSTIYHWRHWWTTNISVFMEDWVPSLRQSMRWGKNKHSCLISLRIFLGWKSVFVHVGEFQHICVCCRDSNGSLCLSCIAGDPFSRASCLSLNGHVCRPSILRIPCSTCSTSHNMPFRFTSIIDLKMYACCT